MHGLPRYLPAAAAALLAVAASIPAGAREVEDKFWVRGSAYLPQVDTTASVGAVADPEIATSIDFERDLELSDRDALPAVNLGARLGGNWLVEADFYTLARSGEAAIERDIVFDGATYPAAAVVRSEFETTIYRATVGYALHRDSRSEAGLAVGLHLTKLAVALSGEASIGNAAVSALSRRRELLAPLPTVGAFARTKIGSSFSVGANVDYLALGIGDYDGRLLNLQADASYAVTRAARLGLMYRLVDYRVEVARDTWRGRVDYRFSGPAAFIEIGF